MIFRKKNQHVVHDIVLRDLQLDMRPRMRQLFRPLLVRLARQLCADGRGRQLDLVQIVNGLISCTEGSLHRLSEMSSRHTQFMHRYEAALDPRDKRSAMLSYCSVLGARGIGLWLDRMALNRFLDYDAIVNRYSNRFSGEEQYLAFALERVGMVARRCLGKMKDVQAQKAQWEKWNIEGVVSPLLAYRGDVRVRVSAFKAMVWALKGVQDAAQLDFVKPESLQTIFRSAMDERQEVWIQCEAIELLQSVSLESLKKVVERRLTKPGRDDDLFVRRRAVYVLGENISRIPELNELFPLISRDPSPFVRQELAKALVKASDEDLEAWLHHLATADESPQVRAVAVREAMTLLNRETLLEFVICILDDLLSMESDRFVVRTALHAIAEGHERLVTDERHTEAERWLEILRPRMEQLLHNAEEPRIQGWAATAMQRVTVCGTQGAISALQRLESLVEPLKPGETLVCTDEQLCTLSDGEIAQLLSVLAKNDFGFEFGRKDGQLRIRRGDKFAFRLWRVIYEWRNPAPDKRQAHPHSIGRTYTMPYQIPSSLLGELTLTRVPGEPYQISDEGDWRPYLPLPDMVLSSLNGDQKEAVTIVTADGVTTVTPPKNALSRFKAWCVLTWTFARVAELRNWKESSGSSPTAYVEALRNLGVAVEFEESAGDGEDGKIANRASRFFPALMPFPLKGTYQNFVDYFVSVYGNRLHELATFVVGAGLFFVGQHVYRSITMRRARQAIPLVIGGWGTRGKSGTERLKAGLLNAVGSSVFSKTTGCEAMFLFSPPFGRVSELYIFRPFDKATIWEQTFVVRLAAALRADVFLWECMALNPRYVRIMQRQWMRDDLSTITNAYPDHEDLQGPAGYDIPYVMNQFMPEGGAILTTEDLMLPILRSGARELNSSLKEVDWYDAGVLTPDILQRFPYAEHPNNIALVTELAKEMGLSRDFALKEMADRVVPDIGVLKAYPVARIGTRRHEFINGMSANERFACLVNWERMGFAEQDPLAEPGVWLTALINNRADRVSRSKMFAGILVGDLAPDRYYIIGTNVNGLLGYMDEAWQVAGADITLWPKIEGARTPSEMLETVFKRFRLPTDEKQGKAECEKMLGALGVDSVGKFESADIDIEKLTHVLTSGGVSSDAVRSMVDRVNEVREAIDDYRAIYKQVSENKEPSDRDAVDGLLRDTIWKWIQKRCVPFVDPHVEGETIITTINSTTPPGFFNRIMGMQNIKGPGLEFVYCWQAWDIVSAACARLESSDGHQIEIGAKELADTPPKVILCFDGVKDALVKARSNPAAQRQVLQSQLGIIESRLRHTMIEKTADKGEAKIDVGNPMIEALCDAIEAILDVGDSVRRANAGRRIYRDLTHERISLERAAVELRALTKRQKGGWLKSAYLKYWRSRQP